ncbi:MAG: InlB B-repeat-containing protein [Oscillospiraceae bacterium]|nr:InlB B-repeat-containing protein [Oscillospiraceae bacterium]
MAITAFADSDEEGQGSTDLSSEENGSSDSNTGSQAGDEAGTLEEENSGGEGTLPEETPGSEEGTLPEEIPGSEADTPAKGATTDEKGYPLNEIAALSAVGLSSPLLAAASGENDSEDGDEKEENSEEENKEGSEGGDSAEGSITAGKEGIIIDGSADAHFDVLISGTLKAGETPILIGENVTPDNISITVWKIETLNPESTAEDRENAIEGEGNFSEGQKNTTAGEGNIPDDQKSTAEAQENVTEGGENIAESRRSGTEDQGDGTNDQNADTESHVVFEKMEDGPAYVEGGDSDKVEKAIQYIIKVEPSQDDMIQLNGVTESHGYEVAKENDKVTMKISVPDGYTLTGAFNGLGDKVALDKDENDDYYVEVPRGGGVFLSIELDKDDDDFDADAISVSTSYNRPAEEENEIFDEIIFDLNGGILDGEEGPLHFWAERGKLFTLLKAPVREGYYFVCWSDSPDVGANLPGQVFRVTGGVTFTAVWEKSGMNSKFAKKDIDDDYDDDDDDDDNEEDTDSPVIIPVSEGARVEKEFRNITVKDETDRAVGVKIDATGTGEAEVEAEGKIAVTGGERGAVGLHVTAAGSETTLNAEVETEGGMKVEASGGETVGISASSAEGGTLVLEFEGSVESAGAGAVLASDGGTVTLIIGQERE